MTVRPPLGLREDLRLEIKGRDSLREPDAIAREVVAMLNADGGEIWVGVREDGGVAVAIEAVADAERQGDRLLEALVDLVEPPLHREEVRVQVVGDRERVLRVSAEPVPGRGPYALRRGARVEFPVRFGSRLRPMTRAEIGAAFAGSWRSARGEVAEGPSREEGALRDDQYEALGSDRPTIWIGVEPEDSAERLDLGRLVESGLLEDPTLSGNRRGGVNFCLALRAMPFEGERAGPQVELRHGRSWLTVGRQTAIELSVSETGSLRSVVRLDEHPFLFPPEPERSPFPELHGAQILNPKALLEYPASVFRLLRALGETGLSDVEIGDVRAAVALTSVEGWYVRPGPDHPGWDYPLGMHPLPPALRRRPKAFTDGGVFVGPILRFSQEELSKSPDSCAFRLMAQVFAAFGWLDSEIPYFDRGRGKLDFLS